MAVYAAQVSNIDRGVGRMLEVLRRSGADENTLVLFLSDNGAAPDGGLVPTKSGFGFGPKSSNSNWRRDGVAVTPGSGPDLMPGPHETFAAYGLAWATVGNTPFRDTKQSAYEGGIRTPLIARWPTVIRGGGKLTQQSGHVIDLMATCLDVAGAAYPAEFHGRHPTPMEGKSLAPVFRGQQRAGHEYLAWKCSRGRAIQMGDWKLVRPKDNQPWELYNLSNDGGETDNLVKKFPDRVGEMTKKYESWRTRVRAR